MTTRSHSTPQDAACQVVFRQMQTEAATLCPFMGPPDSNFKGRNILEPAAASFGGHPRQHMYHGCIKDKNQSLFGIFRHWMTWTTASSRSTVRLLLRLPDHQDQRKPSLSPPLHVGDCAFVGLVPKDLTERSASGDLCLKVLPRSLPNRLEPFFSQSANCLWAISPVPTLRSEPLRSVHPWRLPRV